MKKSIISIILVCYSGAALTQSYEFQASFPFDIQLVRPDTTKVALNYLFYDWDYDTDMDLILIGYDSIKSLPVTYRSFTYFIDYQENIGNVFLAEYRGRKSFLEDFSFPFGLFFPGVGDLNGDQCMDWIIYAEIDSTGNQYPLYYRGSNNQDQDYEVLRLTDFGLDPMIPGSLFYPHLTDLDQDGDLDLLLSGAYPPFDPEDENYEPVFLYAKNIGTPTTPKFMGWFVNPYGLQPNANLTGLISGDIDLDGDIDLLGIEMQSEKSPIYFYENTGGPDGKPAYALPVESPFGLPLAQNEEQYLSPSLVDMDGDGDLDFFVLLLAEEGGGLLYYENNLLSTSLKEERASINKKWEELIKIYPNPSGEEIFIENESVIPLSSIRIFTVSGKLVKEIHGQSINRIRLNDLENGVYLLELKFGNEILNTRIIKI